MKKASKRRILFAARMATMVGAACFAVSGISETLGQEKEKSRPVYIATEEVTETTYMPEVEETTQPTETAKAVETEEPYNIKEYIENLGWEENDGELSVRTSFVAKNDKTSKGYLSKIIKPGCLVGVFATDGASQDEEVARGYVETWNPVEKSGGHTLKCTCYDELYKLQKSQDNRYFPSGTGTKSAIEGILDDWEIPQGSYQGPNASHGKTVENNKYLSDIIINLLDDAAKKGEEQCFVQARKGKTSVIPRGSNKTVERFTYHSVEGWIVQSWRTLCARRTENIN